MKSRGDCVDFSLGALAVDIPQRKIDWIWPGYFARGKLHEIIGDPAVAKSTIMMDMAARMTTGRGFPDGDLTFPVTAVAIITAEDGPSEIVAPRATEAGANLSLLRIIGADFAGVDGPAPITFPDHIKLIERTIEMDATGCLFVDPITAFLSDRTDSHRDASIRKVLAELNAMAERQRCAIVLIRHLNKMGSISTSLYRGGGSIAFTAAARTSFLVGFDPTDDAPEAERRRILACVKNNLSPKPQSLAFRLGCSLDSEVAHVEWLTEPSSLTADDLLRVHAPRKAEAVTNAVEFLETELCDGAKPEREVIEHAQYLKISAATLRRARKQAHIETYKKGFSGGWYLRLKRDEEEFRVGP